MATTNRSKRSPTVTVTAFSTGCEPITARVSAWENMPNEAHRGRCVSVNVGKIVALGFEQQDNALEALARQLEALAANIRKLSPLERAALEGK